MLDKEIKSKLLSKFARNNTDVGSSEVQIALLSERIRQISEHLKSYPKDTHSHRGLLTLIGKRRTLLNYLQKTDAARYAVLQKNLSEAGYIRG